jgi:hypothetical protein
MPEAQRAMPEGEQGGDVTLTRLREIRDGLDENLTEREAIDELDFIINDAPSGYFPQDILNKVDQAKRDLEEEFTTWAGRGDSEASTESAISSVMSFLDSKESRGEAAPTRFMPEGVDEDKFYSQLDRVITDKVPTRATAQQIMATIDPTRGSGVKADEIKWSGIEQALASLEKDGKVSKEDLLNYLRNEGRVRFEEVTLSKPRKVSEMSVSEWAKETMPEQYAQWESATDPEDKAFFAQLLQKEYDWRAFAGAYSKGKGDPKFSQYVLPGGENYREVVLAMPTQGGIPDGHTLAAKSNNGNQRWFLRNAEGRAVAVGNSRDDALLDYYAKYPKAASEYTSSHFPDIPNYVAHMRTNERTLDDGSEGLFVEEFQSDRHQAGRKKGYDTDIPNTLPEGWRAFLDPNPAYQGKDYKIVDQDGTSIARASSQSEAIRKAWGYLRGGDTVADAPFRTTWPIQLFKRALRDAVDGGKDWIGWTTGETQNDRFDLSKQVDSISVPMVNADGSRSVRINPKEGTSFKMMVDSNGIVNGYQSADQFTGKRLDEVVGKDMADKIIALESPANFEGNGLKVGGSGMKRFYDAILPKEIGKYVDKMGGKVEKADMTQSVEADIMSGEEAETGSIPIWKVNITPEMRKISQTGQMRFMPEANVPTKKPLLEENRTGGELFPYKGNDYVVQAEYAGQQSAFKIINQEGVKKETIPHKDLKSFQNPLAVDKEVARKADASKPIIIGDTGKSYFVLDGNHRLTKAMLDGLDVEAFVLSEDQTNRIRLMPEGDGKAINHNIPDKEGGKMRPSTWGSLSKVGYSPEASEKTQIATTAPTYESIVKANATQGMEVLDFSAGRGIGTKAMKAIGKKVGFNVEGYEPFSNEKTRVVAPEYEGEDAINQIPDNSKDIIINNAVLNVVPEDTGRQIVNQIYSKLKPGGSAFINVMGWNNIKNRLDNPKTQLVGPREVVTQKGTFQKGYTAQSLRSLIEQELPDAKIVRTSHGDIGFKVTKPAPTAETMPVINQPAMAKRELEKSKPKAKGDASAIANAAKLK